MDALYIAQSGLVAQQTKLDAISNNIANLNTDAYKKISIKFESLMRSDSTADTDAVNDVDFPSGSQPLAMNGVFATDTRPDFTQGALSLTEHPLDIALSGAGFIELESLDGERALSRGGRMVVDRDGFLAMNDDWRLTAQINIPPGASNLRISASGIVEVDLDDGRRVEIGALDVLQLREPDALEVMPNGLYAIRDDVEVSRGEAGSAGFAEIRQGYREQSNVALTEEMVELIVAQRGFQLNARVVQLADQLLETINNLRR